MAETAVLTARDLAVPLGPDRTLEGLTFSVGCGESVVLLGESGVGKSSLIEALCGLRRPRGGDLVQIERPAVVFQETPVFTELTVGQNVALTRLADAGAEPPADLRPALGPALTRRWSDRPLGLSGGERRMLALCRGVYQRPRLLILDEPTAGVDSARVEDLARHLLDLWKGHDFALLTVTHDLELAARVGQRFLLMTHEKPHLRAGRLEPTDPAERTPEQVAALVRHLRQWVREPAAATGVSLTPSDPGVPNNPPASQPPNDPSLSGCRVHDDPLASCPSGSRLTPHAQDDSTLLQTRDDSPASTGDSSAVSSSAPRSRVSSAVVPVLLPPALAAAARTLAMAMVPAGVLLGLFGAARTLAALRQLDMQFRAPDVLGRLLVGEGGSTFVGVLFAGTAAAALASRLGLARLQRQRDALVLAGCPPILFWGIPAAIAHSVCFPLLAVPAVLLAAMVAVVPMTLAGIEPASYLPRLLSGVRPDAAAFSAAMLGLHGAAVGLAGYVLGMRPKPDHAAVGRDTTLAVLAAIGLVILLEAVLRGGLAV